MGGYGSGWQGPKRATVEDSLVLSVSALMRGGGAGARQTHGRPVGLDLRGRKPAARHRALQGRPHGARRSVAPAALLRERRTGVTGGVNPRMDGEACAGEEKGAAEAPGLFNGMAVQSDGLSVVSSV